MAIQTRQKKTGIRTFLMFRMGAAAFLILALSAFLAISVNLLQSMTARLYADSTSMEAIEELESNVYDAERQDILARTSAKSTVFSVDRNKRFELAEGLVNGLTWTISSEKEHAIYITMRGKFEKLKSVEIGKAAPSYAEVTTLTNDLVKSISDFENINRQQKNETLARSAILNKFVNRATIGLLIVIMIIMIVGSVALVNRIVQPTSSLVSAADRFGKGDFTARATVHRTDELGVLARTFNDMAERIESSQKDRAFLIASVAHDLKNPLAVVGAAAYRLLKKGPVTDDQSVWLTRIIRQTERIDTIIGDLLDSSRIETGKLELKESLFDLAGLIKEQSTSLGELYVSHNIVCDPKGRLMVKGDRRLLERVIANIVSNAVKYSPEESTITVSAVAQGQAAVVTIEDRGAGIPPEELEEIFFPFRRLPRTRDMAKGFGLGLYSVKRILDLHGGEIIIRSELNKGTAVEIRLPLSQEKIPEIHEI